MTYPTVDPLAKGRPVVCLGTGPSLTREDVDYCQGRACVIAIKDAVFLAPWADVLYSGEVRWWDHHGPSLTYSGPRYTIDPKAAAWATVLRNAGAVGLETRPDGLRSGNHSGYQSINLSVHLGARMIVLLGYDMQPGPNGREHFFGSHAYARKHPPFQFLPLFRELVQPLEDLGIAIWNCSRQTALTCFPRCSLAEALA